MSVNKIFFPFWPAIRNIYIMNVLFYYIVQRFKYRVSHIKLDASMDLTYDLGYISENLRRMNYFDKFNKTNRKLFLQKMLFLSSIICVF